MSKLPKSLLEKMISFNIWNETCPVHHSRLRLLEVEYVSFSGDLRNDGKIIVFDVIADEVFQIFHCLKEIKFPICQIRTIDEFNGSDQLSMEENNSSGFNGRKIYNSNLFSIHAYGLAVDLNPLQNPYVSENLGEITVEPSEGKKYLDRSQEFSGKITLEIVKIFKTNKILGWGGNWQNPKDWHHFEVPRSDADKIIAMGYKQGKKYLETISFP